MSQHLSPEELGKLFFEIDSQPSLKLSELAKAAGLSLAEDYIGADLSDEDLSEDNLSSANFTGANLSNANLQNTNLSGAILNNADLSNANLSNTDLSNANLSGANLFHANLNNSNLENANLSHANLEVANLTGVRNIAIANLVSVTLKAQSVKHVKLLTIAVPAYNRASLLDKQLAWLSEAIRGFESECEILVSDNCSTDNTQDVIKKWQAKLTNITFKINRNPKNLGVLKNITYCLKAATTKYVWTIGDNDPIQTRSVSYVINKVKEKEDISLIFLNFSGRNQITNEPVHPPTIIGNRWFDADTEDGKSDSKAVFEHCFDKSISAVIFLTATIYRTDLAKEALDYWSDAENNWIFLAYVAGYCAARGSIIVTKETFMECIVGVSYWQREPKSALLMQYKHTPEVIVKLEETGYSKQFCRRMILRNLREANLKVLLGALRRWPLYTLKTIIPFWAFVVVSAWQLTKLNDNKLTISSSTNTQQFILLITAKYQIL
jgi:glycosyltransferase involved in cell wall biosynthesis